MRPVLLASFALFLTLTAIAVAFENPAHAYCSGTEAAQRNARRTGKC